VEKIHKQKEAPNKLRIRSKKHLKTGKKGANCKSEYPSFSTKYKKGTKYN
jgi:hypothetical protein